MRTSKFTVEQIAHALRRVEGGLPVAEICRELSVTERRSIAGSRSTTVWARPSCASFANCETRTAGLSRSSQISLSTAPCRRMRCEKDSEAGREADVGHLGTGDVPGHPASCLWDVRCHPLERLLPKHPVLSPGCLRAAERLTASAHKALDVWLPRAGTPTSESRRMTFAC